MGNAAMQIYMYLFLLGAMIISQRFTPHLVWEFAFLSLQNLLKCLSATGKQNFPPAAALVLNDAPTVLAHILCQSLPFADFKSFIPSSFDSFRSLAVPDGI